MADPVYEDLIKSMPAGVDRAILRLIQFHKGKDQAIKRMLFLKRIRENGFIKLDERQMRYAIHDLRRQGHLICALPGKKGGYYLANSRFEYMEFKNQELLPKITDMMETVKEMDRAAEDMFGNSYQPSLIG